MEKEIINEKLIGKKPRSVLVCRIGLKGFKPEERPLKKGK